MGKEPANESGQAGTKPVEPAGDKGIAAKGNGSSNQAAGEQTAGTTAGTTGIQDIRIIGTEAGGQKLPEMASGVKKQGKRSRPEAPKGSKQQAAKAVAEAATAHTAQMLSALLKTVSDICALRPGMQHWQFTAAECEAIAKPAAEIMAKHSLTDKASEYADYIALITALGVAFVPRMIYQMQSKPKGVKQTNVQSIQPKQQPAATAKSDAIPRSANRGESDGGAAQHGNSPIKQLLTPIVG